MDPFSYIANADVSALDSLYQQFKKDPSSVDESWRNFFLGFDFSEKWKTNGVANGVATNGKPQNNVNVSEGTNDQTLKEIEVVHLIRGIRARGHMAATINPLKKERDFEANLELKDFNLSESDLDTVFQAGIEVFGKPATLREIYESLKKVYITNIGFEYQYIRDRKIKSWFRKKIEREYLNHKPTLDEKIRILTKLNQAVSFEQFLHTKFLGKKRFSLEGGESAIPAIDIAINYGAELGVEEVVFGMAHRGRLNVLINIMQKPYAQIFNEFEENVPEFQFTDGDVKYHMGYSSQVQTPGGKRVSLKLMPNPSHLDAVDPVVLGYARARADAHFSSEGTKMNDFDDIYDKILPLIIHGDAALAGQGIIYETIQMSNLKGYYVGGSVHLIINNQIGFTTNNYDSRSSLYCSDIAKILDTPIFHVNSDDPEAVAYAMKLAIEFRQEFNRDVYVDLICYRKYGHNEADEPRFTQPKMYQIIGNHKNTRDLYIEKLLKEKELDEKLAIELTQGFNKSLQEDLEKVKQNQLPYEIPRLEQEWNKLRRSEEKDFENSPPTGISAADIKIIGETLVKLPAGFTPLKQIEKVIEERKEIFSGQKPFNWATGELLAYGSILNENKWVRMTGQDVQRGTFSHRHAVLHDTVNFSVYNSLENIHENQGKFEIYNSLLSEYGVLGFEFGYAKANPNALVIWEAQFGDFANGAQIMIDQFIASSETKWHAMNGIVLLLPHGYEGQGPEHSSARPERFLQLAAEFNMFVCYCTTPANFFHMIRRQLALPFRKPCIHMSPKSMLRHPLAVSPMSDFEGDKKFLETIGDDWADPKLVKKILFCSGKIYFDLLEKQRTDNRKDVAIIRVEQLFPFPKTQIDNHLKKYPKAAKFWVQEEPLNMGAWSYIVREFPGIGPNDLISRKASASPASGYNKKHLKEQALIINKAFE